MVYCDILAVQQDQRDEAGGYATSIRKYYAPANQQEPGEFEWGAIAAWAWAMSRAMDYLQTDRDVDAKRVYLNGVSRFGKVVMWAGAQDPRFATTFSGESGCGGAVIVRRQYGETIRNITDFAPYWFNRKFKEYAGDVNALPVDWHELVAPMLPGRSISLRPKATGGGTRAARSWPPKRPLQSTRSSTRPASG
jgi:hypothetical protein